MTVIEIVAWSIFGASALVWIVMILRKFPLLASIDLGHVRSAQDRVVKQDLVEQRLRRKLHESSEAATLLLGRPFRWISSLVLGLYHGLVELENRYRNRAEHEQRKHLDHASQKNSVMELLSQADHAYNEGEYSVAEKKFIEVISLDARNVEAYRGLGRVYVQQRDLSHARASFSHVAKLDPNDADVHCSLAEVYAELDKMNRALKNIEKALELQPNNPKYLDTAVDLAIRAQDVYLAQRTLAQLRKTNPENQKIEEYENQILQLKTKKT